MNELETELARASAKLDRATLILRGEPQVLISWDRPDAEPTIEGDLSLVADAPPERGASSPPNGSNRWTGSAGPAAQVEEATERLLDRGEAFSLAAVSRGGRHLEISGRPVSGSAVMRIRDVSGERLRLAELHRTFAEAEAKWPPSAGRSICGRQPAWRRDLEGRMVWCNAAYAQAVEAPDVKTAVGQGGELFDLALRREAAAALKEAGVWKRRAGAVVNGERRTFDAAEVRTAVRIGRGRPDVSELAALQR